MINIVSPSFKYLFLIALSVTTTVFVNAQGTHTTNCDGGTATTPTTKTIAGQSLQLVWHDEFDGTELDATKWQPCPAWKRQGGSYWEANNAWLNGCGKLKMKVSERNDSVFCGAIRTRNLYDQKYGYFEVRCKIPQIQGGWAAFWMMPYGNNPGSEGNDGTELDIFESINGWNNKIQHAIHWDGYGAEHQHQNKSMDRPDIYDNKMHIFGMKWTPNEYIFYIDDVETWRTSAGGVSDVSQYLKLTMEVSNQTWPGDWNNQVTKPITWTIDYVRTYALPEPDCNGVIGGTAYLDNCLTCVEGNTGKTACTQDCAGVWGGSATEPNVTTSITHETCGQGDGSVTFSFPDEEWRSNIEFSTDGGGTYPTYVADNVGSTTVSNLAPGNYHLFTRWGDDACPVGLGTVTISNEPLPTVTVATQDAECGIDNGVITFSFQDDEQRTGIEFSIDDGATYPQQVNDNSGSYSFTGKAVGTYHVWARWGNDECPVDLGTVTIGQSECNFDCNGDLNGTAYIDNCDICVEGNTGKTACTQDCAGDWGGNAVEPNVTISKKNELCGNGNGTLTFTFPDQSGRSKIEFSIDGGLTYPHNVADNIGSTTMTGIAVGTYNVWTRWGNDECPVDIGTVTFKAKPAPTATASAQNSDCNANNGSITFSFPDDPSRTGIEFSLDGGVTYPKKVNDNTGSYSFINQAPGTYDVWVRWGDDSCPVDLGTVTVENACESAPLVASPLEENGCTEPQYVEGASINQGDLIQNINNLYMCDVAGWCSGSAWAYEPGVGDHWTMAWTLVGACDGTNEPQLSFRAMASTDDVETTVAIVSEEDQTFNIRVYNASGQIVYNGVEKGFKDQGFTHIINNSSWTKGIYLIMIATDSEVVRVNAVK